jgi:predicted regulator of Ras-like GTPase activity (Roadblock/LC7/MglB family)
MNLRRIGAAVVVASLAAVACGKAAQVVAPRLAVREAAQSTFDGQRGRFTFSLVGDEADMAALFEAAEEDR